MRGDIFELRVNPHAEGHDQKGRRYAVVLQSDTILLSTVVAAPTTTGSWGASFHPEIELRGRSSRILIEQMVCVDPAIRFGRKVGRVSPAEQIDIDRAVKLVLGLF
ncbi:MAG TPA: type II toxin-antitoxin system PemK/MazF family toxin [Pseudonocardiaceae bacterium]|nr:type II toxin-antitoxin system PemK/MazF family toxin [Pseudonocardiaceae bacterium]